MIPPIYITKAALTENPSRVKRERQRSIQVIIVAKNKLMGHMVHVVRWKAERASRMIAIATHKDASVRTVRRQRAG